VDTRAHTPDTGTAIQDVETMKLIGRLLIKQSLVAEVIRNSALGNIY